MVTKRVKDIIDMEVIQQQKNYQDVIRKEKKANQDKILSDIRAAFNPLQCLASDAFDKSKDTLAVFD